MSAPASIDVASFDRGVDEECAACGARPDVLHASGEAMSALLCDACMAKAAAEHARRCAFCGFHPAFPHRHRPVAWQDVGGRPVCDSDCAEKEAARQAAVAVELVHSEVDGLWGLSLDQDYVGPCGDLDALLDKIAEREMS